MARVTAGKTEENTLNLNPEFDDDKPTADSGKQKYKNQSEDQWDEGPTGQAGIGFAGKLTVKSKEEAEKSKRKAQQVGPVESTWDPEMQAAGLAQEVKKEGQSEKPKKTGAGVLSAAQGKKGGSMMRPAQQMGEVYFPALGEEPPARKEEPVEAPKSTGWDEPPQPAFDADGKPRFVNKKKVAGGPIDTITPIEETKPAAEDKKTEEFVSPMKFTNTKAGGNFKPLEQNKTREEKEKAIEAELAAKREQAIAQRKKDEEARTAALLSRDEKKADVKKDEKAEEPKEEERWRPAFKSSKAVNNNISSELASEKYDEEKAKRDKEKAEREKEKAERAEKGEKGDKHDKHDKPHFDKPKKEKKESATKPAPAQAPKEEAPAAEEKPKVEKPNALGKFVPQEQHGVAHFAGWD